MKVLTIAPCKESFIISVKRVSHFCTRLAHGDNLIPFSDIDIILEGLIDLKNELKSCRDMMEQKEFDSHVKLIEDLQRLIISRRKSFQDKENKRTEQVEVLQAKPSSVFTEGSDLPTQNTRENTQSAFMEVRDEFSREENGSVQSMQALMLQQKGLSAMEVDQEIKNHNKLTAELAELTTLLKESTLTMSESISTQNHVLGDIQQHATSNFDELNKQKKKMAGQSDALIEDVWTNAGSIFWVLCMFILAYLVIRLVPKSKS